VVIAILIAGAVIELWLASRALDRRIENSRSQSSGPEKGGP
jgi:hypothetical protein